ncbi:thiamine pyrophosphate-binding protein [Halomontanus rarus]|uniref:thiamine pyrophosphate-binding protein n=1 Tax=Halomontanus rarus TaxID=3034020 RepID=UPI0023E84378|nr:thiamine pyrophosphate-binding protein [Halovivax sp. TS33]
MTETTGARIGADLFVDALEQYGVEHVFGNPGTTELPVMNALSGSDLEYVLGLHEDIAVGAAAGYATTRRYHADDATESEGAVDPGGSGVNPVGVVNLHLAPGTAHGLGNLYAAMVAGAPLVVTAGNHSTDFRHEEPALSGDLVDLADPFTKWSAEVLDVETLPTMLRRAFRVALTPPRGPVFLALPLDVTMAETDATPERLGPIPSAGRGDATQIDRAADLLVDADEPALIVGDGVARAGTDAIDAAVDFAEAAGCRVHGEILASEVNFPGSHDHWVSYVPPDEDLAARTMDADTLVFVGTSTNTTLVSHDDALVDPETTCIHVGDDPWELGKNRPADAAVIGDPGEVLADLATRLEDRLDPETRRDRLESIRDWRANVDVSLEDTVGSVGDDEGESERDGGEADDEGAHPSKIRLVEELRETVPDPYVVDEGVTSKYALMSNWPFEAQGFVSNKGGGLGYGLPAAVGAAIAEAERDEPRNVVGFVGDGSYLYYPHALYTAARNDVDLTVVVSDNQNYRILKDNMEKQFGGGDDDHEFVGMDFEPSVDLVANAESHGAAAERVDDPDEIRPAIERAIERDGPSVVDVLVHD